MDDILLIAGMSGGDGPAEERIARIAGWIAAAGLRMRRVDGVTTGADALRRAGPGVTATVLFDLASLGDGAARIAELSRLETPPAVVVLSAGSAGAESLIGAGAQEVLDPADGAEPLLRALRHAHLRQARANRGRPGAAKAGRSVIDAARAALDPMLRQTAAALDGPLLPSQRDRLEIVRRAADDLRRTLDRLEAEPRAVASPPAGLSILLVEDNPIGRLVASGFLKSLGHRVTLAEDGAAGLAAATAGRFDLILMDMQMPVMDGCEATRAIRALAGPVGRVPVVALTAGSEPDDDARCRAAGMDDCLRKPLSLDALRGVLERLGLSVA